MAYNLVILELIFIVVDLAAGEKVSRWAHEDEQRGSRACIKRHSLVKLKGRSTFTYPQAVRA